MEHLEIAYDLGVIMMGLAALAIAGFWAVKTKETYLRDFCLVYALFTAVMILTVLNKYLSTNLSGYSSQAWFAISAVKQVVNFAVIVAVIRFFLGVYQVEPRRTIVLAFAAAAVIGIALTFSPIGARLDAQNRSITFGPGYHLASAWYLASFTFALVSGYRWLDRVWTTAQKTFILGLLFFATVGYVESLFSFLKVLRSPAVFQASESNFLFSSIPYALYGVFLIVYLLRSAFPATIAGGLDELPEHFLTRYGITEREREIIQKVIQGKSNADIASELFISLATVKTHLHNIYTKIGADSRYDLLARIRSNQ